MIDRDLIEEFPEIEWRRILAEAFAAIATTNIIELQKARLLAGLTLGAIEEDEEKLAKRVKAYRLEISKLDSLQQLGETFMTEQD